MIISVVGWMLDVVLWSSFEVIGRISVLSVYVLTVFRLALFLGICIFLGKMVFSLLSLP